MIGRVMTKLCCPGCFLLWIRSEFTKATGNCDQFRAIRSSTPDIAAAISKYQPLLATIWPVSATPKLQVHFCRVAQQKAALASCLFVLSRINQLRSSLETWFRSNKSGWVLWTSTVQYWTVADRFQLFILSYSLYFSRQPTPCDFELQKMQHDKSKRQETQKILKEP